MLFLIPARGGSKRLPEKNVMAFAGLPLFRWSVATAMRIASDGDSVIVSTDIPFILKREGVPRPRHLCEDDSSSQDVVNYYFDTCLHLDVIVLLQPTSPTRRDSLVRKLIAHGGQVRSVTNGKPNGQCYVYRRGHEGWIDIETEQGHDIDTLEDFIEAEKAMMELFQ